MRAGEKTAGSRGEVILISKIVKDYKKYIISFAEIKSRD